MQQSTNGPRGDNEPWPLLTAKSILTQTGARADQPCRTVYMKMGFFENCLKKRKILFWSCIYTKTAFSLKSGIFRKFENTALFGFVYGEKHFFFFGNDDVTVSPRRREVHPTTKNNNNNNNYNNNNNVGQWICVTATKDDQHELFSLP